MSRNALRYKTKFIEDSKPPSFYFQNEFGQSENNASLQKCLNQHESGCMDSGQTTAYLNCLMRLVEPEHLTSVAKCRIRVEL
jgi:hypothetical protein